MRVSQLPGIDALILDEAHERSLNTDVLFATVKRLLTARRAAERRSRKGKGRAASAKAAAAVAADGPGDGANGDGASGEGEGDGAGEVAQLGPRRVIIASATLDPAKLSGYFFGAPVLRVPGRCFPVQIFHASRPSGGSGVAALTSRHGSALRGLWEEYHAQAQALLFVVDAADPARMDESRDVLWQLLAHPDLSDIPVLVFANQQDTPGTIAKRCSRDDARIQARVYQAGTCMGIL